MAAQGVLNARATALSNPGLGLMRQNPALYGNQNRPQNMGPPPLMNGPPPGVLLLEQKITTQHTELQRLLTENQRLAATHVALRQELAAAQQEVQRMQSMIQGLQNDKEVQVRYLMSTVAMPRMPIDIDNICQMYESLKGTSTYVYVHSTMTTKSLLEGFICAYPGTL